MPKAKRLDQYFSVFNNHLNNASDRANAEFIAQFGQESYDSHIAPFHVDGIMAIFAEEPTPPTIVWVALVTTFVNENRE